jgi:hypothetical protein
MESSLLRKRLVETVSRSFLEEWERGVVYSMIKDVNQTITNELACKNIVEQRKAGATKPTED